MLSVGIIKRGIYWKALFMLSLVGMMCGLFTDTPHFVSADSPIPASGTPQPVDAGPAALIPAPAARVQTGALTVTQFYPLAATSRSFIKVTGTGFEVGTTQVFFGGTRLIPSPTVYVVSATELLVDVPVSSSANNQNVNGFLTIRVTGKPDVTTQNFPQTAQDPSNPTAKFFEFVVLADVTGEGDPNNTNDVALARAYTDSQTTLTPRQLLAADVAPFYSSTGSHGNGLVSTNDITFLRAVSFGQTTLCPSCVPENCPNLAPGVNAGPAQTILVSGTALLNGSGSDNDIYPSCKSLLFTWSKDSGPTNGTVNFTYVNGPVTPATFSLPGTYVLRLTASDTNLSSSSTVTIRVLPADGCDNALILTLPVTNPPQHFLPSGSTGNPYSQEFSFSNAVGNLSFEASEDIPIGLIFGQKSGKWYLSGVPQNPGSYTFQVTVTDDAGKCFKRQYRLNIVACPNIVVGALALPEGILGEPYYGQFNAGGGQAPYTYSIIEGSLPSGLTMDANGAVRGTPAQTGSAVTFKVNARDVNGCHGTNEFRLAVIPPCGTITLGPPTLPDGQVGQSYSQSLTAGGGGGTYTFTVFTGSLPPGLVLNSSVSPNMATLEGEPSCAGTYTFVIHVDSGGCRKSREYTVTVSGTDNCSPIELSPDTLPNARVGAPYTQIISATGGTQPYTFSISSGALPAGLTLDPGGSFAGSPTVVTQPPASFTITARDQVGRTGSRSYSLTIIPCLTISPGNPGNTVTLPAGTVEVTYTQNLTVTGGSGNYSYGLSPGNLPSGFTVSPTGTFSGTASSPGTFTFSISVTDTTNQCTVSQAYSLTINGTAGCSLSISPETLPGGFADTDYSQQLTVSGGTAPYTFSITQGELPNGITLSPGGLISGRTANIDNFPFRVQVTDSTVPTRCGTQMYTLSIGNNSTGETFTFEGAVQYSESEGIVTVTVRRQGGAGQMTVNYSAGAQGDDAVYGTDYEFVSPENQRTLTFSGSTNETQTFQVRIINDGLGECNEQFTLKITGTGNQELATTQRTIEDDDTLDEAQGLRSTTGPMYAFLKFIVILPRQFNFFEF